MDSLPKDKGSPEPPICLKFNSLPKEIRERLLKKQRGESEGFSFKTAGVVSSYVLISIAVLWFALFFYLTDDFLWSPVQLVIFSLISLIASYLLIYNLYKLFRRLTSGSKCYLLITPLYVIDIYFNDICYWNMEQLMTVNSNHQSQDGRYEFTKISLILENGSKTFNIKDRETAEEIIEQINHYRKLFIESTVRNNTEYLNSNDDFEGLETQTAQSKPVGSSKTLQQILTFSATAILTIGIMLGGFFSNNYYDDKKSWELAQTDNRASSFRAYLQTHPDGRWRIDADAKLQNLYDKAVQKYQDSLNEGFDPKAVDAVLQVLKYAAATQNYRVGLEFERHNEIPPDIVEKLKKEYEIKNMVALDDSFSDEKMMQRETALVTLIADAFRQVIPDDILEISAKCSGECVNFLVKYSIKSDSIYYDSNKENVPPKERTYYPGIFIDWNFGVQIPNQPQAYNFTLVSNPADHISYENVSNSENDDLSSYCEALAASSFDDFKANLISKTGVGTAAETTGEKPSEGTTPTTTKKNRK